MSAPRYYNQVVRAALLLTDLQQTLPNKQLGSGGLSLSVCMRLYVCVGRMGGQQPD